MKTLQQKFIEKAKFVHGDKYDYSKVFYIDNRKNKVCIICPEHGEFWQTPYNHLLGYEGCKECALIKQHNKLIKTTTEFIRDAELIHKNKYNYNKVVYKGKDIKVCIICPEHGEFWQTPHSHLNGRGCPKCGGTSKLTTEEFIKKARQVHGDKYNYSKVNYIKTDIKVIITCPIHGDFEQKPQHHLTGSGCPLCGVKKRTNKITNTLDDFIKYCTQVHGGKYDYSKVLCINNRHKVCIVCPEHGEFWQTPHDHLQGHGCPKCGQLLSNGEKKIVNFLKECEVNNIIEREHNLLNGKQELDIWLPDYNLAIEYNGLRWHSELFTKDKKYHLNKTNECKKKNIRLIHIFEDELLEHEDIVLSKIKHLIKKDNDLPVIGGRKCIIKEIAYKDAKSFLNSNHIQGISKSTIYLGAFYENVLMAVMSFKDMKNYNWELTRFATNKKYRCPGIANKLLTFFKKNVKYNKIKSFLDLRWGIDGENLYTKLGFLKIKVLQPDYYYVKNNKRFHKFGFRKEKLIKKYPDILTSDMTETEMTKELGYYKIWNCGLIKYELINENIIQ